MVGSFFGMVILGAVSWLTKAFVEPWIRSDSSPSKAERVDPEYEAGSDDDIPYPTRLNFGLPFATISIIFAVASTGLWISHNSDWERIGDQLLLIAVGLVSIALLAFGLVIVSVGAARTQRRRTDESVPSSGRLIVLGTLVVLLSTLGGIAFTWYLSTSSIS